MARGGLNYGEIGFGSATFVAGNALKSAVAANGRDSVVNLPVVISDNNEVDLGSAGDVPFGFVDVYENDGRVGVQYRGFREDVPTISNADVTPGRICLLDGDGALKDTADGIGVKQKMTKKVTTGAVTKSGNVTVKVTAAGKAELADGKDIVVALTHEATATAVATAIQAALNGDSHVSAFFTVGRTTDTFSLEAKVAAANDATMAIGFTDTGGTGAVLAATSNTTGVADNKHGLPVFVNVDNVNKKATVFLG